MPCTSRPADTCASVTSSVAAHDGSVGDGDVVSLVNVDDNPVDGDAAGTATPVASAAAVAARTRAAASAAAKVRAAAPAPSSMGGGHDPDGLPTLLPLPPPPRLPRQRRRDDRRVTGQADAQQERDGGDAYAPSSQEASALSPGLPNPSTVPAEEAAEAPSPNLEGDTSRDKMSMDDADEAVPSRTAPRSIKLTDGLVDEDTGELGSDGWLSWAVDAVVSAASTPIKSSLAPTMRGTTGE